MRHIQQEPSWCIEERQARLRPVPRLSILRLAIALILLAGFIAYGMDFRNPPPPPKLPTPFGDVIPQASGNTVVIVCDVSPWIVAGGKDCWIVQGTTVSREAMYIFTDGDGDWPIANEN